MKNNISSWFTFLWFIKTEYAGHAREVARTLRLDEWNGVVIVSGDGLIFEVCLVFRFLLHSSDVERVL